MKPTSDSTKYCMHVGVGDCLPKRKEGKTELCTKVTKEGKGREKWKLATERIEKST